MKGENGGKMLRTCKKANKIKKKKSKKYKKFNKTINFNKSRKYKT